MLKKTDLGSFKLDVDKLDFDKLKTTPADLSKLSNVLKNDVVQKTVYNKFLKKVNGIQTIDTIDLDKKKTDYDAKIKDIDNQIRNHDKYIIANDLINS